jgi:sulfur carrier protein
MNVIINGKNETITTTNLRELLADKNLEINGLVVLLNDNIIKKDDYHSVFLKEEDSLEILNFVSGG